MYKLGQCRLGHLLTERNMTPQELAKLTKISKTKIMKYIDNEAIISFEEALIISMELDCKMNELYEWSLLD